MTQPNTLPSEFELDSLGTEYYKNADPDAAKQDALEYVALALDIITRNVSLVSTQIAEDALDEAVARIESGGDDTTIAEAHDFSRGRKSLLPKPPSRGPGQGTHSEL